MFPISQILDKDPLNFPLPLSQDHYTTPVRTSHTQTTISNNALTLSPGKASINPPITVPLPCARDRARGSGPTAFATKLFKSASSTASLAARNTASRHSFFAARRPLVSTRPRAMPARRQIAVLP